MTKYAVRGKMERKSPRLNEEARDRLGKGGVHDDKRKKVDRNEENNLRLLRGDARAFTEEDEDE